MEFIHLSAKGCDASWKHDNEPPEDQVEFSDDEEERNAKAKFKGKTCQDSNIRSNEVFRKRRSKGKFKNVSHLERFTSEGIVAVFVTLSLRL